VIPQSPFCFWGEKVKVQGDSALEIGIYMSTMKMMINGAFLWIATEYVYI
jgi:formylmethanofuran dehydrogenase subunit C